MYWPLYIAKKSTVELTEHIVMITYVSQNADDKNNILPKLKNSEEYTMSCKNYPRVAHSI